MSVDRFPHVRIPAAVFIAFATAAMTAVMVAATFLYPFLQGDERHHIDMIWWASDLDNLEDGWPGPGELEFSGRMENALDIWHRPRRARNAIPLEERPATDEIPEESDRGPRINRMTLHPPLFYLTEAAIVEAGLAVVGEDSARVDLQWWFYRLINLAFLIPLPWLMYRLSAVFTDDGMVRRAATASPILVPGLTMRVAPMTANETLLILSGTVAMLLMLRMMQGRHTWWIAAGLGVSIGIGASTKAFGLVLYPVLAVAYLVALRRTEPAHRARVFLQGLLAAALACLVGLPWYVWNVLAHGQFRPDVKEREVPESIDYEWAAWLYRNVRKNWGSYFGGREIFGPDDVLTWVALGLMIMGVILAFRRGRRDPVLLAVLLAPTLLLVASWYFDAFVHYLSYGREGNAHARYYYLGLPGVLVMTILGFAPNSPVRRWMPAVVASLGTGVTVIGLHALLTHGRWWGGEGGPIRDALAAVRAWSPLGTAGPVLSGLFLLISFAGLLVVAWLTATPPRQPRPVPAQGREDDRVDASLP